MTSPKKAKTRVKSRTATTDATVLTIGLPREMRVRSIAEAEKQKRSEGQLWRSAYAYAESQGWKIPLVD